MTHDTRASETIPGIGFAILSAACFGTSGAFAAGLMDAGWSSGAAVAVRVTLAALALAVPAWYALDRRWHLLREEAGTILAYGVVAVAGCQLAYFNAIQHMEVGAALLIEYTAPVAVLGWAWFRHGLRPSRVTAAGGALAVVGLVLVLDLIAGAQVSAVGVLWALGAMVGAAMYFVLSAGRSELPPVVLAAGAMILGAISLLIAAGLGVISFQASTQDVEYASFTLPFWAPLAALGLVAAAVAYVAGIAASRRLGARLASFVALLEVLFALGFAWLLLRELPNGVQFAGAALVLAGVVVVKLGERSGPQAGPAPYSSESADGSGSGVLSPLSSSLPNPETTSLSAPS